MGILLKLCIYFFCLCSLANAKINGSVGGFYEKASINLYGIFAEVNSEYIGGYLSIAGNNASSNTCQKDLSLSLGSLGLLIRPQKYIGIVGHIGFYETFYVEYAQSSLQKEIPIVDPFYAGPITLMPQTYKTIYYGTYGGGILLYAFKGLTLHLDYTCIPSLHNNYIGAGIGLHIF